MTGDRTPDPDPEHIPYPYELVELREAIAWHYSTGGLEGFSFTSAWAHSIATQPDGGLLTMIDAYTALHVSHLPHLWSGWEMRKDPSTNESDPTA